MKSFGNRKEMHQTVSHNWHQWSKANIKLEIVDAGTSNFRENPHEMKNSIETIAGDSVWKWNQNELVTKSKAFMTEYLQTSSIHGLIYLARVGLHIIERVLWMAFICIAFLGIASLSRRIWERYQTSPMVISMDRNKLIWNTTFPSLTICPHMRVDHSKLEDYIGQHPDMFENDEDKKEFGIFIATLANITYENVDKIPVNNTFGIPGEQYLDLLYQLKWDFEPELSSDSTINMNIDETITEFGICYSVNSQMAKYNSYDYWKGNRFDILRQPPIVTVHPLDGEIYAQVINLSTSYDVYFHGPKDIPDMHKQRYTFWESDYTTVALVAIEIFTSEASRDFTVQQRKCRFPYEAEEIISAPMYSFGLCRTECRMRLALRACDCIPHFYRHRVKNGKVLPICDIDGLMCLAFIKKEIISLKSETLKIDCNCQANCDDSNFFVESYITRPWFLGANLQWGINNYPKMQLRRDVLFSFADVLVYIGGLVGFFLGCSILSFTEFIYFFTIRFMKSIFAGGA